jgi:hypothetical protein
MPIEDKVDLAKYFVSSSDQKKSPIKFVHDALSQLTGRTHEIGAAFHSSLSGAYNIAAFPGRMAFYCGQVVMHVTSLQLDSIGGALTPILGNAFKEEYEQATHQITEDADFAGIAEILLRHTLNEDADFHLAEQTLKQCLVITWTSLEVLTSDLFVFLLNSYPVLTQKVMDDPRGQKRYQYTQKSLVAALYEYGYDLSRHMGEFLAKVWPIDDVDTMRAVVDILFEGTTELQTLLKDERLWRLHKSRNIIVHRAGIIDGEFLKSTGIKASVGAPLRIAPDELVDYILFAGALGVEILKAAQVLVNTVAICTDALPLRPAGE